MNCGGDASEFIASWGEFTRSQSSSWESGPSGWRSLHSRDLPPHWASPRLRSPGSARRRSEFSVFCVGDIELFAGQTHRQHR